MIDLSPLRSESLLGKLARLPLRLIPPGAVVPILQGQLRGARWIVGSGVHGCWLGFYESAKQREIAKRVRRGSDVFDVGAHVGFYTLLFSRLAGTQGRVAAFEPNRANLALLRRHLALNDVANVEVVQAAVTSRSGLTRFASGDSSYTGHTSREGDSTVAATSLDDWWKDHADWCPSVLKVDVEGSELHVLRGAEAVLRKAVPVVFVATHGPDLRAATVDFLRARGYDVVGLSGEPAEQSEELVATPRSRARRA